MMKKFFLLMLAPMVLFGCQDAQTTETDTTSTAQVEQEEELVSIENNHYVKYYKGKQQIEMEGYLDAKGERQGVWKFYTENGMQLSMQDYMHGKKHGVSVVNFPNGRVRYTGEYREDVKIGVWKFYDEQTGKVMQEIDYKNGEK